ncbi:transglycosylase family protein [Streptomyces sp. BB1-1-1]|uniref:transglycosylase family protein n=1 Tax=Streptomyces sp. BB1-1-1 TaxID=3074430 RepID=UPI002877586B|nr:transglycosylase family protein [Streptomyces sp. BB1-1-1]WND37159.1 transglycosylase family protein [Streptomyces sp. BB1-1-1]
MLSGNGRHRRPRQAPALVVAAGVTGSAIAIPLLGATGAHAADGANWDRVAECETGGAWSQNSGNGYYGGLQLSQDVWERYGGTEYAPSADQASRSQQIRVAEKLHADQGIAAWPTCALLAGMGNGPAPTDSGTGSTGDGTSEEPTAPETSDTPEPSGTTESPEPTSETSSSSPSPSSPSTPDATSDSGDDSTKSDTSPEAEPTGSAGSQGADASPTASPETGERDKAGQTGGDSALTDTGDSGAGKHRGDSADEGAADGRAGESSGRHASRGEDEVREVADGSYTVRSGDSLWGIADSLGLDGGWRSLYVGNKQVVGTDPDHILPGQTLTVTGESGEK